MAAWAAKIVGDNSLRTYAEVGILRGVTVKQVAAAMPKGGTIHLFDYEGRTEKIAEEVRKAFPGKHTILYHSSSRKSLDSYNWSLMKLLRDSPKLQFDYVYLDGAHTWCHDALAFLLLDKFLRVGGLIELDDYDWTIWNSMENTRRVHPKAYSSVFETNDDWYTMEQMKSKQVALVVDLLIKRAPNYVEIVPNRVYKKTSALTVK